jgi:pyruvate carboxylase
VRRHPKRWPSRTTGDVADDVEALGGHPVSAYLSVDEIVRVARDAGADPV